MGGQYWTADELRYLVSKYPVKSTMLIALFLDKPIQAIYSMAHKLGLKKSESYLNSHLSGRFNKFSEAGLKHRFKKGNIPANKGKKMPNDIKEKIKHTWFKRGNTPHNTKFDGHISVRLDKNGRPYAHIRRSKGKYELLHRCIWVIANGPVPEGMIVAFKNGDSLDVRLDNLELITREENMLRNTKHKYPKDLQDAIMAFNKLRKTINSYGKK